jgi:D-alanine-D-alanine ligase
VLAAAGVPVPRGGDDAGYPCIVKPAGQDASAGIGANSVCRDPAARARAIADLEAAGLGPATIEAWLPGRELLVALWGDEAVVGEVRFAPGVVVLTWASKWDPTSPDYAGTPSVYPADIPDDLRAAAVVTARDAARVVGAHGYLRVDMRCDDAGTPRVIDINPNPDITPDAGLFRAVHAAGWTWRRFLQFQVTAALARESR